uniref:Lga2 protein n=1 Tax=Mycosarcoma maydis TaxID=5270 RepID=Q99095_MYCMD|nr:lga2 [Ustilago maydis]
MMLLSYIRPSLHVIVRTRPLTGSMPIFKPQSFTAGYRKLAGRRSFVYLQKSEGFDTKVKLMPANQRSSGLQRRTYDKKKNVNCSMARDWVYGFSKVRTSQGERPFYIHSSTLSKLASSFPNLQSDRKRKQGGITSDEFLCCVHQKVPVSKASITGKRLEIGLRQLCKFKVLDNYIVTVHHVVTGKVNFLEVSAWDLNTYLHRECKPTKMCVFLDD